ncbi:pirin family protein [Roseofilum reptotaenium CS-1145]|uniref:Quercetin 2,3-dioxygenase n=1 Tax=Roseofilum reptotaenium AO1-A TaxID=1925591 RepID=A0A1L9QXW1_9CYAN|nr:MULTISPECIES: pirin family protein [Roseofilum]MBP0030214.1 pirin family protein [Roseofilum sp. Guam]MDB9517821.1 pirin family protein [Roseofilum reptotaenium CS-1145]OJJ27525.1 quercetin 2,3-dioxygenase [Roseofilum reptotaenium AO1-A]
MVNAPLKTPQIVLRKSSERGQANHGWLKSNHTFSFAGYYDPKYQGFRHLLVINEDRIQGGSGFGTHPHRDMEIISYVINGALEHKDSMGNGSVINPGDVQIMSAGTGVTHSEYNHSQEDTTHFLQIWIAPNQKGLKPGYQQEYFSPESKQNQLRLLVSPDGEGGSVVIHQEAKIFASILDPQVQVSYNFAPERYGWIQMIRGKLSVNGMVLETGDGAAIANLQTLNLQAEESSEFLLFDLA